MRTKIDLPGTSPYPFLVPPFLSNTHPFRAPPRASDQQQNLHTTNHPSRSSIPDQQHGRNAHKMASLGALMTALNLGRLPLLPDEHDS
jgi:hypothetical protein